MGHYDLEIALPATASGRYLQRLNDYKRYGLFNFANRKVHLSLLVGTEYHEDFYNGWPISVAVDVLSSPLNHEACKVYHYYSKELISADWYARFDDDSITNVDDLLSFLENNYESKEKFYISNELADDVNKVEEQIIDEFSISNKRFYHEVEASILSKSAIESIVKNDLAKKILERRSNIAYGWTDQCLALAASVCKIYPVHAMVMSKNPFITEMFKCNTFFHIHKVSRDNLALFSFVKSFMDNDAHEFAGNYKFERVKSDNDLFFANLKLLSSGLVSENNHSNESVWSFCDNTIYLIGNRGRITSTLKRISDDVFEGLFMNGKSTHRLTRIS